VTRACQGMILSSVELVQELISKGTTKTGLEVDVTILDRVYETGRKVSAWYKKQMRVVFDEKLSKWNYTVAPLEVNSS
jgi:hypothetical protein